MSKGFWIFVGLGAVVGAFILLVRSFFWSKDDVRRWAPAVILGPIVFWIALLIVMDTVAFLEGGRHLSAALNYAVGILMMAAVIAFTCFVSIAVAPRGRWKTMAYLSGATALTWTLYLFVHDNMAKGGVTGSDEFLGGIVGWIVAFRVSWRRFGGKRGPDADVSAVAG